MRSTWSKWVVVCLLAVSGNLSLQAQAVSGTIVGTVLDPNGAVVPNAQVVITLTGQSTVHTAVTNESGKFN